MRKIFKCVTSLLMGGLILVVSQTASSQTTKFSGGSLYMPSGNINLTGNYNVNFGADASGANAPWAIEYWSQAGGLNFHNPTVSGNEYKLFIKDNGNVGIGLGDNNPLAKLHVNGSTYIPSGQSYWIGATGDAGYRLRMNSGDYSAYIDYSPRLAIRAGTYEAMIFDGNGRVGIWNSSPQYMLDVASVIRVGGAVYLSDKRMKRDIKRLDTQVDSLMSVGTYSYNMATTADIRRLMSKDGKGDSSNNTREMFDTKRRHIGFLAQEVKTTFPGLVYEDSLGILSIDYIGFIPVLVETAKRQKNENKVLSAQLEAEASTNASQQDEIAELQKQVKDLSASLDACCKTNTVKLKASSEAETATTTGSVETTAGKGIELFQNTPNPFGKETTIAMTLPQAVKSASLYIYDLNGRQIKAIPVAERGEVSVLISDRELTAGMYHYALVADGGLVDTKVMVVTE